MQAKGHRAEEDDVEDKVLKAVEVAVASGADYADARLVLLRQDTLGVRNGAISTLELHEEEGLGVRVLKDGAWGYAAGPRLDGGSIARIAREAVEIARSSSLVMNRAVTLASEPLHQDRWTTPFVIDPFTVPLDEKLSLLYELDSILRSREEIRVAVSQMHYSRRTTFFASSEGSVIHQEILHSGCGIEATAVGEGDVQRRTYPMSHRGQAMSGGYEVILAQQLKENAPRVRDEAASLLTAKQCPSELMDVIIGPGQLCLQIHESVGHPNELDRVLGWEAAYAGTSFNTPEHLGTFQYGSEVVNLVADNTLPGGMATAGYDDEGVAAQRWYVVKQGVFQDYFTARETAPLIDAGRSRGCCRAESWYAIPITRIPNLSLLPGEGTLDELIADTGTGVMMDNNKSWSIDQRRLNFQFGCEIGWEIKGGKLGAMLKNCTYQGITPQFWRSCDAVCGDSEWKLMGLSNCGKGQPGQRSWMTHGCAPARFRQVQIGVSA
jgi:TldD protein